MTTAQVVRTDVSGVSFVLDVTALELDASLSVLDFEVTHNGAIVSASYAKTSVTQLTYTGANVALGTRVVARRVTSLTQAETTFVSTTTASALTNALNKERLRIDELDNRITYVLAQLVAGGISIGTIPVSSTAFGAAWNGDNTNTAARAALYNKFTANDASIALKADALNAALTGNPTAPTAAVADNDTSIATTAFVKNSVFASVTTTASVNLQGNNVGVNLFTNTAALGANVYRFAYVRMTYTTSGSGKAVAINTAAIKDNAGTIIENRSNNINNAAYFDNGHITVEKLYAGTFTGNYTFTLFGVINAATPTDVYTLSNVTIEVLYLA